MNLPCPTLSSMLSPKIHRSHMLPIRCDRPPCRNVERHQPQPGQVGRHYAVERSGRSFSLFVRQRVSSNSHASAFERGDG